MNINLQRLVTCLRLLICHSGQYLICILFQCYILFSSCGLKYWNVCIAVARCDVAKHIACGIAYKSMVWINKLMKLSFLAHFIHSCSLSCTGEHGEHRYRCDSDPVSLHGQCPCNRSHGNPACSWWSVSGDWHQKYNNRNFSGCFVC